MSNKTSQMEKWIGEFGKQYTDRNAFSLEELDLLYEKRYGITRMEMNVEFIGDLSRSIRILEVGSNIGNQLLCLQKMGFTSLYGIELQSYAVELSKSRTKNINIIEGSAFDLPFKDGFFDMVFTSGLLIHIAPGDISMVMNEIHRCTTQYIWGMEYWSDTYTEVEYREHRELLWKTNFPKLFLDQFSDLIFVKEQYYKYIYDNNIDVMYLLEIANE